jgi:hypothetical protein
MLSGNAVQRHRRRLVAHANRDAAAGPSLVPQAVQARTAWSSR